jgi:hypothetical protein
MKERDKANGRFLVKYATPLNNTDIRTYVPKAGLGVLETSGYITAHATHCEVAMKLKSLKGKYRHRHGSLKRHLFF